MKTYDLDPIVVSENTTNITDLLIDRVAATPKIPLFAIEQAAEAAEEVAAEDKPAEEA